MRAIFAGNGTLPFILAGYLKAHDDEAPLILTVTPDYEKKLIHGYPHAASDIGKLGECFSILKKHSCKEVIFAGKIPRDYFHRTKRDKLAQKYFEEIQNKGDDYAVKFAYALFQKNGFKVIAPQEIFPDIMCKKIGNLGSYKPNPQAAKDIQRGKEVLDILSEADVGQAIIIHHGLVLGVEAIEGTSALIERCGTWVQQQGIAHKSPSDGPVLVKLPKLNQTHIMDLPAIGLETINLLIKHQFAGIAVKQNGVLLIGAEEIIERANERGLFINVLPPDYQ